MADLLTPKEAADALRCSVRKIKGLPIPIVRLGRNRLYDRKDIARYIEACKCTSTSAPKVRSGGRNLASKGLGLDEALKLHPEETPTPPPAVSETKLSQPPRPGPKAALSRSLRLIKPAGGTGSSTDGA